LPTSPEGKVRDLIRAAEKDLHQVFAVFEERGLRNQERMLVAFQKERVGTHHFPASTGYGYGDAGRETLERVFARVFGGEAALVRQQIVSGTHIIHSCLSGILRPGDELLFATGRPYDTLRTITGLEGNVPGNLKEFDITTKTVPLQADGGIDLNGVLREITPATRVIAFQRSCGYEHRPSIGLDELATVFTRLRQLDDCPVLFVDNCYGEFVETCEPPGVGAHLTAGSLMKNPGGGWIPSGGYVVGETHLIKQVAARLYAPGLEDEVGPSLLNLRLFFQGFFDAPHRVTEMLKAAALFAQVFQDLGFPVAPAPEAERTDIIQRIDLGSAGLLLKVCRSLQQASPVESYVSPEPAAMPGYPNKIVMAAGTFISGATSELSADAPITPPYSLYVQGCLSYFHAKLALARILTALQSDIF
jgi:cystathionine beta-lyase family protein involved in aluminum resistance